MSAHWGAVGSDGDANGDGLVNIFDINAVSANWTGSAAVAVPEPSTIVAVSGALVCSLVIAARRRSPIAALAGLLLAHEICMSPAYAAPRYWPVEWGGNGHAYELRGERTNGPEPPLTWSEARDAATIWPAPAGYQTGHLVTIRDAAEDNFMHELFWQSWPVFWIGYTDELVEGEWRWIDDTPGTYTDWGAQAPNSQDYGQYVVLGNDHLWRAGPSGDLISYVVEYEPIVIPGDVNIDFQVNVYDINLVSAHWGGNGPIGDANGDGAVNVFDINLISSNWGATINATAVPEPSAVSLLFAGLVGIAFWRSALAAR